MKTLHKHGTRRQTGLLHFHEQLLLLVTFHLDKPRRPHKCEDLSRPKRPRLREHATGARTCSPNSKLLSPEASPGPRANRVLVQIEVQLLQQGWLLHSISKVVAAVQASAHGAVDLLRDPNLPEAGSLVLRASVCGLARSGQGYAVQGSGLDFAPCEAAPVPNSKCLHKAWMTSICGYRVPASRFKGGRLA